MGEVVVTEHMIKLLAGIFIGITSWQLLNAIMEKIPKEKRFIVSLIIFLVSIFAAYHVFRHKAARAKR